MANAPAATPAASANAGKNGSIVTSAAPSGAPRAGVAATSERLACSFRVPICVEGTRNQSSLAVALVPDLERVWRSLTVGLALPEPDVDPRVGAVRVELGPISAGAMRDGGDEGAAATALTAEASITDVRLTRDPLNLYDRAYATIRLDPSVHPGCARDHALAASLARASLARLAPAIVEPLARGMTDAIADLAVACAADDDARYLAQTAPQRAALGSKLFWGDFDASYGASPGALLATTWALIPTRTEGALPPSEPALPDPFTVLHRTFDETDDQTDETVNPTHNGPTLNDVLLDIAVRRMYIANGRDLALDWHLPWPAVPRRVKLTPLEPLGSAYVAIDLTGPDAPPDLGKARLRVEAEWEQHAALRFALIKLDADGRPIGRMNAPVPKKFTSAQMSMVDLSGAASVIVVVTNAGDHSVPLGAGGGALYAEPHAALFTLAAE